MAVAMVIFYHLGISGFQGGFVGVDVFFVLSGFLITRLLFNEITRTGKIAPANFWLRRAKRLLPNALLTLAFALAGTWLLMSPYRWPNVSRDIFAAALFVSNFRFASNATDYFHFDDPPSPILHFWSLSVEEQFYFALPAILIILLPIIRRRPRAVVNTLLAIICVASLTASIMITRENQPAAFFGTFARVWQLALGGLLGINFERCHPLPERLRKMLAWIGAAAIAYAAFAFNDDTPYPGYHALIPTIGAFLLLLGLDPRHKRNPLRAALSTLPMRWIGDRSYSLYLWHWPVIIFAREYTAGGGAWSLIILTVILLAGHLAYEWVERPIHQHEIEPRQTGWAGGFAVGAIALICAASTGMAKLPATLQSADRLEAIRKASADFDTNYKDGCHAALEQIIQPDCAYGAIGASHKVVLFGDSHAAQWLAPLKEAATQAGWELRAWTKTSCPSASTLIWYSPKRTVYNECTKWRRNIISKINQLNPQVIVLAATSAEVYAGSILRDEQLLKGEAAVHEFKRGLSETIDELTTDGRRIIVIRDNPAMYKRFKECIASGSDRCGRDRRGAVGQSQRLVHGLQSDRVTVLDFTDLVCDAAYCPASDKNGIRYLDAHHFTASFARTLWPDFLRSLMTAPAS